MPLGEGTPVAIVEEIMSAQNNLSPLRAQIAG
jgi:hypothetical protein